MNFGIITNAVRPIRQYLVKNSTTILTVGAAVGTIATAIFAAKGAIKARDIIKAHDMDEELKVEKIEQTVDYLTDEITSNNLVYYRERTFLEKAQLVWTCYTPSILMGGATIACIFGAHTIDLKRNAALAAAYSLSEEARKEFRDKVVENIGEKKVKKIDHEINQDRIANNPLPEIIPTIGFGTTLYCDRWSGQYFYSDRAHLDKMQNAMNRLIQSKTSATINSWYDLIGLNKTKFGVDFGWIYRGNIISDLKTDFKDSEPFTIRYDHGWAPDGETPCAVVDFTAELLP